MTARPEDERPAPARLADIDPVEHPPLALYQSPWTVSLAVAFIFRGAGTYVIDDIDNAGVERKDATALTYRVIRKEVMSKKGWTNCRPLAAFCPDGFLHPNLSRANYAALDKQLPLAQIAKHHSTTVPRLIRDSSNRHGMWSLAGPDRAMTGVPMDAAETALRRMIMVHEQAVLRTLPLSKDHEPALRRLRHLMPDPGASPDLLSYFQLCLSRGLSLVKSEAPVLSAARDLLPPHGGPLYHRFLNREPEALDAYNEAAKLQGSRPLDQDHLMPYYTVQLDNGERAELQGEVAQAPRPDQIIAPKILALEGVARMALPLTTATRATIRAREHAYRTLGSGSSQVFFDSNWLEAFAGCTTEVTVPEAFQPLLDGRKTMPVGELTRVLAEHATRRNEPGPSDIGALWARWMLQETLHDLQTWHYPLLTYAIGGDDWLERLRLSTYASYI